MRSTSPRSSHLKRLFCGYFWHSRSASCSPGTAACSATPLGGGGSAGGATAPAGARHRRWRHVVPLRRGDGGKQADDAERYGSVESKSSSSDFVSERERLTAPDDAHGQLLGVAQLACRSRAPSPATSESSPLIVCSVSPFSKPSRLHRRIGAHGEEAKAVALAVMHRRHDAHRRWPAALCSASTRSRSVRATAQWPGVLHVMPASSSAAVSGCGDAGGGGPSTRIIGSGDSLMPSSSSLALQRAAPILDHGHRRAEFELLVEQVRGHDDSARSRCATSRSSSVPERHHTDGPLDRADAVRWARHAAGSPPTTTSSANNAAADHRAHRIE